MSKNSTLPQTFKWYSYFLLLIIRKGKYRQKSSLGMPITSGTTLKKGLLESKTTPDSLKKAVISHLNIEI